MLLLARRLVSPLGATVAALLFTFWGFRWYSIIGQLNISLASALLPWLLWAIEDGMEHAGRSWLRFSLAGVIWAISISSSLYFLWIGGVAVAAWLLGHVLVRGADRRKVVVGGAIVCLVAGVLSLPYIVMFWRASRAAATSLFTIYDVNVLGASLNSLWAPALWHQVLRNLARTIYLGPADSEAGLANLGLLASFMALAGAWIGWRKPAWRPVLVLAFTSLVLALGLTLRWNDRMVQWDAMVPVNRLIWRVGAALKPGFFFVGAEPVGEFRAAIPLPGLILSTLVPYFEAARVFARYALAGGLAVFLLAALTLDQVRAHWLRYVLAALLVFAVLPSPTASLPFPPATHPVFDWLRVQDIAPDGIVELYIDADGVAHLPVGGEVIWATREHGKPTLGGASSVWPQHTLYLSKWLAEHPQPFRNPDLVSLLRAYRVRLLALQMRGGGEADALRDARQNSELRFEQCFEPTSQAPPWNRSICIFTILPSSSPEFNVLFREGWSGPEDWGRWIDGTEARAIWVATAQREHVLRVEAFPFCAPDEQQTLTLSVNGEPVISHNWENCDGWSADIAIPAELVRVGENELSFRTGYAVRPVDVSGGENPDDRALSLGFSELRIDSHP